MAEKLYRVRVSALAAVLHPETGVHTVPDPRQPYPASDPLVREYPWLFVTDDELAEEEREPAVSVPVERATQAPGERRPTRRRS